MARKDNIIETDSVGDINAHDQAPPQIEEVESHDYPVLLYRCPGSHQGNGFTYETTGATDSESLSALIADGWFKTLPQASEQYFAEMKSGFIKARAPEAAKAFDK